MTIQKIHNNNIVTVTDDTGRELIVTGSGIGFQKHAGDQVEETRVEKIFEPRAALKGTPLERLLRGIPTEIYAVTEEIVQCAQEKLGVTFSDNIYLGLIDHIDFAVERAQTGKKVENVFSGEIRFFYRKEYEVALDALRIIEKRQGVRLPQEEAAYIALHLINASLDGDMHETMHMAEFFGSVIRLIEEELDVQIDRDSTVYFRLVAHLKLFSSFLLKRADAPRDRGGREHDGLFPLLHREYPKVFGCTEKIARLIRQTYGVSINTEEKIYLSLYILPILNRGV